LLRRTLAERFRPKQDGPGHFDEPSLPRAPEKKHFAENCRAAGNKAGRGFVVNIATSVAFKPVSKDAQPMTISTRIALGVSAAALSLSLASAPAAFAMDKMGKDEGMKKGSMSKNSMKKDTMSRETMKKDDGMKNDGMKKDEGMKKN
jgi:pentapeptide MXKDX repeat protein